MKKKITQQLKEPEREIEGIEFRVENSNGSVVVPRGIRGLSWFFEGFL